MEVRALTRDPRRGGSVLDPQVTLAGWDGTRVPGEAIDGVDAVVHLSGEPIFGGRLSAARRRRIRASRVDSTRSLVQGLAALRPEARPGVLVCASAVGFYGSRGEEILSEDAAPGEGFLADVCRAWEDAARGAEEHGVRSISLRIGIVLAREGGALPLMALPFRVGLGGRLGSGRQWVPWIHADDLVSLVRASLQDGELRGAVNAVAPDPLRNADFTRALARQLRRPARLAVPGFALRAVLGELAQELLGSRRVTPQRAQQRDFRFAHPRIETALEAELGGSRVSG
jgi:uncharacterized protein (TIGR01777 family)